jgi:hypothetical protein
VLPAAEVPCAYAIARSACCVCWPSYRTRPPRVASVSDAAMHAWRHSLRKRHNKYHSSTWLPGPGGTSSLDDAEVEEEVDDCEIESLAQGDKTRPCDAARLPYGNASV